jgi:hypothetical protein
MRKRIGNHPNEGALAMRRALQRRRENQTDATRVLGVAEGVVHRWLFCDRLPIASARIRILEYYGVPIGAWDRPIAVMAFGSE